MSLYTAHATVRAVGPAHSDTQIPHPLPPTLGWTGRVPLTKNSRSTLEGLPTMYNLPAATVGCPYKGVGRPCSSTQLMVTHKSRQARAPAFIETRGVGARGQEWQAEKLTGNRAQKSILANGKPRWTYEVKWQGASAKNTYCYEPHACLLGWEAEIKKVDDACDARALLPQINPAAEAMKAREVLAQKKADNLERVRERLKRLKRLKRLQKRKRRLHGTAADAADEEDMEAMIDEDFDNEDARLDAGALASHAHTHLTRTPALTQIMYHVSCIVIHLT